MAAEDEVTHRKLLDIWDGPLVKPASADVEAVEDPKDEPETASDEPQKSETRAIGSTTLGAVRGWIGGWVD